MSVLSDDKRLSDDCCSDSKGFDPFSRPLNSDYI